MLFHRPCVRRVPPQQTIYGSCVHALLEGCFDGYNATVFANGQVSTHSGLKLNQLLSHSFSQTGSGKTYTMGTGLESLASFERLDLAAGGGGEHLDELSGIVPRAAHHLFAEIERRIVRAMQLGQPEPQFEVSCQFVEVCYSI
jgi:kinesin family member 21